jgi:hypothetical protein
MKTNTAKGMNLLLSLPFQRVDVPSELRQISITIFKGRKKRFNAISEQWRHENKRESL